MKEKAEYLAVDFDSPPGSDQLTRDFGDKGWGLVALLPVTVVADEGAEPLHKLRAYFVKFVEESRIMVPKK